MGDTVEALGPELRVVRGEFRRLGERRGVVEDAVRVGLGAREGPRGGGRRLRFGRPREELEAQAPRVAGKILQKADVAEVKRHDEDRVPRQRGVRRRTRRPPSCCLPTLGSDVDALGPRKRPRQRRGIFALHILDREASTADGSRHDQQQKDSHAGAISRSRFRLALEPTRKGPVARERVRPAWWTSVARRRGRFPGREALFDRGRSLRFGMLSSAALQAILKLLKTIIDRASVGDDDAGARPAAFASANEERGIFSRTC